MREIRHHRQEPPHKSAVSLNDAVRIETAVDPRKDGTCVKYNLYTSTNGQWGPAGSIKFHDGLFGVDPIDNTIRHANGITMESLLAVVLDRLENFQKGDFPCQYNELAKQHAWECIYWLQQREKERQDRGVSGRTVK